VSVVSVSQAIELEVDWRELATILAALRFHQDENLQGGSIIADQKVGVIATDGGKLTPLDFDEVEQLCERLNGDYPMKESMNIEPPPRESGEEQLFRVVYVIDVNVADARQAAEDAHHIMSDPAAMAPILHILDHAGKVTTIDLTRGADPAATE
jgi:hypothetical protein